ncbi:MAG: phosphomannomutase/phosphoglucomutase, partial [Nitrospira sp.]|nr:phosphomannomutase/phosphoglucomutase [Nitrospira sp.]
MAVSSKIFREYDIRGVVGEDITKDTTRLIGWAFAKYLLEVNGIEDSKAGEITVAIGRDVRVHSTQLSNALIDGITSAGLNVIDVGICPTPLLYFSLYNINVDGGVMITGSHNPAEFNGFKLCVGKEALHGEAIQHIRQIIELGKPEFSSAPTSRMIDNVEYTEIVPFYLSYLREQFVFPGQVLDPPLKVVVDSGNGTAGVLAPAILREMGCEVIELYSEPDGRFPHHHPDPTVEENLKDLIKAVKENAADLGVAYDGDADRIGVVDESGGIIWGDRLMLIYAKDICKEWPGAIFVSEVKASQVLYDEIEKAGGECIMWKAGHSLIKAKMKEIEAVLGGEVSGHIFFADRFYGYDDAIYATCRLIEILKRVRVRGQKEAVRRGVSFLLDGVPATFTTPEIRVDCPDDKKFKVVEDISDAFTSKKVPVVAGMEIMNIITVDGVRV